MIAPRHGALQSAARRILAGGIALRVLTWAVLNPNNRDFHLGVILRIVDTGHIPIANETDQSYHPPLYYLIGATVFALTHRPKIVQLVSLAIAIATLIVLYKLIIETPFAGRARMRLAIFAVLAVHPQLITYGLYISNDTLTILLGVAVVWLFGRWVADPVNDGRLRILAVVCGLGLLTKATFLAIVPTVAVFVAAAAAARRWQRAGQLLAIAIVLGCYKYIENVVYFGTPFVTALDGGYAWLVDQARGRTMPWAYVGFDLRRLLLSPLGNERRPYLEMLYETSWYEFLPMSNLAVARRWPTYLTGSAVLTAALAPTVVAVGGAVTALFSMPRAFRLAIEREASPSELTRRLALALGGSVLVLMVSQEIGSHVWSIMHARLLLPVLPGAIAAFYYGCRTIRLASRPALDRAMVLCLLSLSALMLVQHATDVVFMLAHR
jgi:4-amino-4-deoxy-L-arabinose transferase-like glycosyltransferase